MDENKETPTTTTNETTITTTTTNKTTITTKEIETIEPSTSSSSSSTDIVENVEVSNLEATESSDLEKVDSQTQNMEKSNTNFSNLESTNPSEDNKRPKSSASCYSTGSFVVIDPPSGRASRNSNPDEEMNSPAEAAAGAAVASPPSPSPQESDENIHYGKCKWFNVAKGWGFITPNDGGTEVFVHQRVIQMTGFRSLAVEEEVEYEVKKTERGWEATRVSGRNGTNCKGSGPSPRRQKQRRRRMRCYNCGEFANHIAAHCNLGPMPKLCHLCKSEDHLAKNCPNKQVRDMTDDKNLIDSKNVEKEKVIKSKQCVIA